MPPTREMLPTSAAAFIGGLTEKQMHRLIDDGIVEPPLFLKDGRRCWTKLASALGSFYFHETELSRRTKIEVIHQCTRILLERKDVDIVFVLKFEVHDPNWSKLFEVKLKTFYVDLGHYVHEAQLRARQLEAAEAAITSEREILRGMPVFKGTRVPIAFVLESLDRGYGLDDLHEAYPFITAELIEHAKVYAASHPRPVGRPRDDQDEWRAGMRPISTRRVPLPRAS
jgi:uncharacterized protein (DUF433 family)